MSSSIKTHIPPHSMGTLRPEAAAAPIDELQGFLREASAAAPVVLKTGGMVLLALARPSRFVRPIRPPPHDTLSYRRGDAWESHEATYPEPLQPVGVWLYKRVCRAIELLRSIVRTIFLGRQCREPVPPDRKSEPQCAHVPALLPRAVTPSTNATWLREGPYQLVLGAGFVGGMFCHLGLVRALLDSRAMPSEVVGVSAGALLGALVVCLPLADAEQALMTLRLGDFLDPTWKTFSAGRGICEGKALRRKLQKTLAPSPYCNLDECTTPTLGIMTYDTESGCTSVVRQGSIVDAVLTSAALPVLYQGGREIDGGWWDQHGRTAMQPGKRALNHRLYPGVMQNAGKSRFERQLRRPLPLLEASPDPQHRSVYLDTGDKITEENFLFSMLTVDKRQRITQQARDEALRWLHAPA